MNQTEEDLVEEIQKKMYALENTMEHYRRRELLRAALTIMDTIVDDMENNHN